MNKLTEEAKEKEKKLFKYMGISYPYLRPRQQLTKSDKSKILVIAEDIGRHNAVDKVIGHCIIENISLEDKMMLVSGRLSSEIVSKCARWGIPVLVSRTSPTSYAIEIAEKANITLIGFVRGNRFNIYANSHRVL